MDSPDPKDKMPPESPAPTPNGHAVDLSPLEGILVLGEPLDVLFSALLRLQFGAEHDGMMDLTATWPQHEAETFQRAMTRSEAAIPGDRRSEGQRDADRFMAVAQRVFETAEAVSNGRAQGAA